MNKMFRTASDPLGASSSLFSFRSLLITHRAPFFHFATSLKLVSLARCVLLQEARHLKSKHGSNRGLVIITLGNSTREGAFAGFLLRFGLSKPIFLQGDLLQAS